MPKSHPLSSIRKFANEALAKMVLLFVAMYEADVNGGRPSITSKLLLRAMMLQVSYSIRSERQSIGADPVQPAVPLLHRLHGHPDIRSKIDARENHATI